MEGAAVSSRQVMALGVVLALLGCERVASLLHSARVACSPAFILHVSLRAGFWAGYGQHEAILTIVNVYRRMLRTTEHDVVGVKRECST